MNNQGTLVIAAIRPQSDADTFASTHANEALGGHHCVANLMERDSIPLERRLEGMTCYAVDTMNTYQLVGGIENTDWCVFPLFRTDSIAGQINGVQERDYILDLEAAVNYKIVYLSAYISSGSLDLSITADINNVGGPILNNTNVTRYNYTNVAKVLTGQTLRLTVSNIVGAPDLFFTIGTLVQNCGLEGTPSGGGGGPTVT